MVGTPKEPSGWEACPEGELARVAGRLRRRRRVGAAVRAVAAVAVILLAITTIYLQWPGSGEYNYGGITCIEVHNALPALKAGTLDEKTLARVRAHLKKCPLCEPLSHFLPPNPTQTGSLPCRDGCARDIANR